MHGCNRAQKDPGRGGSGLGERYQVFDRRSADGRRGLVVEAARDEQLATELATAVAWAQVDEVRFMEALPVDKRHNAKIDYPELRRRLGSSIPP